MFYYSYCLSYSFDAAFFFFFFGLFSCCFYYKTYFYYSVYSTSIFIGVLKNYLSFDASIYYFSCFPIIYSAYLVSFQFVMVITPSSYPILLSPTKWYCFPSTRPLNSLSKDSPQFKILPACSCFSMKSLILKMMDFFLSINRY